MAKTHQRLKVLSVPRLKTAGYHADGDGLYLQVTTGEAKSWIYRFALAGRRREMGLGPYPAVTLAAARLVASEARALAQAGKDPIAARESERARQRLEEARGVTFRASSRAVHFRP
ncbi:MAG: Arm DNA-binding domain-containing protein [Planctomycetota bacterium]